MRDRPTTDIRLRRGAESDGPMIAEVFGAAREASMPFMPVLHSAEEDRNFFSGQLAKCESLIAMRDGWCAGFVIFGSGWIYHLYVHPGLHRRGLGTELLQKVKALLPEGIDLWTFQANRVARGFFEKNGFS